MEIGKVTNRQKAGHLFAKLSEGGGDEQVLKDIWAEARREIDGQTQN